MEYAIAPRFISKKVTREQLIRSIPVDKRVTATACNLQITKAAFNQRMKSLPSEFVKCEKVGFTYYFTVKSSTLKQLINFVQPKIDKPRKQKIEAHKLTTADLMHNLFESA